MSSENINEAEPVQGRGLSNKQIYLFVGLMVLVVVLIVSGLLLPPFSLGQRFTSGLPTAVAQPRAAELPEGLQLQLGEAELGKVSSVTAVALSETMQAALPPNYQAVTPVYQFQFEESTPSGQLSLALPEQLADVRSLDLYGWDGQTWQFLPSQQVEGRLSTLAGELPTAVAIMQASPPTTPLFAIEASSEMAQAALWQSYVDESSTAVLRLDENGALVGEVTAVADSQIPQYIRLTNQAPIINEAALKTFLTDANSQSDLINDLVAAASSSGFAGVNLDLQGIAPQHAANLAQFVTALESALTAQQLDLIVTLHHPLNLADWQEQNQHWAAIGDTADIIYLAMPLDPTTFAAHDLATDWLQTAVHLMPRHKMNLLVSAHSIDNIGLAYQQLSPADVAKKLGHVQLSQEETTLAPEEAITLALSAVTQPPTWDGKARTFRLNYEKDGQEHIIWLGNAAGLAQRLQLARPYALRGVTVRGLTEVINEGAYTAVMEQFQNGGDLPQAASVAFVWQVIAEDGSVIASETGEMLDFTWAGSSTPGRYTIQVELAQGEDILPLNQVEVMVAAPDAPVEVVEATAVPDTTPGLTGNATVNTDANVRLGPGLTYGIRTGGAAAGTQVTINGRNAEATWFQIQLADDETGWIFGTLLDIDPSLNQLALPIITVAPPAATNGQDTTPIMPVTPVTNAGFELGGQTHGLGNPALMSYAGMNWVKFQHKWHKGDTPEAVAGRIQQAHANGFKVLLSIPGGDHSSIDYDAYVRFLGGVAALGPDAIEVWNEQNIDREWPSGQINPQTYVTKMLAPAYQAIKAANPSVMVISGAPAPTGFFGGCSGGGCDDAPYIAGMAAAGAANYMDCLGIHYNEGIVPPAQTSGDPRTEHYTRYFWGMVDAYWQALGGSRPLCFTELGYLSGKDYGGLPSGFAWANNTTINQHAQWLAESVSLAANSGKVRMVIVFNVDFTTFGADPQAGFAMIRKDGSCPACETLHQVMGSR